MLSPLVPKENPCASACGVSATISKPTTSIGAVIHLMCVDTGFASFDEMGLVRGPKSARELGGVCHTANCVPMDEGV